jgi:chitin synthase
MDAYYPNNNPNGRPLRPLSSATRPLSTLRRGKTLYRPERYQPAAPLLTNSKDSNDNTWDAWVIFSKAVTIWAPSSLLSSVGGLNDKQSRQAWREKLTLCLIAAVMGGLVAFLTVGFTNVICPKNDKNTISQFKPFNKSPGNLGINGWMFDITNVLSPPKVDFQQLARDKSGQDVTVFFQRRQPQSCLDPELQKSNFGAVNLNLC